MDWPGWSPRSSSALPSATRLVHLPPYSPELNPVERVWLYLRERWLSHRVLAGGYDGRPRRRLRRLERRSAPNPAGSARSPPSLGCPLRSPIHEIGITALHQGIVSSKSSRSAAVVCAKLSPRRRVILLGQNASRKLATPTQPVWPVPLV